MDPQKFKSLSEKQQLTMALAMHVRNELEDFHANYLNDDQMKILNQTIRSAIMQGLVLWETGRKLKEKSSVNPDYAKELANSVMEIAAEAGKKHFGVIANIPKNFVLEMIAGMTVTMIPDYWEIPDEQQAVKELLHDEIEK